jgi:hypothetical protein
VALVFDDRAADHVAGSKQIEILIDLVEANSLDRVPDPPLLNERDDRAEIVVIAPERAMVGVLASDEGKERDVDPVSHKAD